MRCAKAELLSEAEVQRLLGAASERAVTGVRNRALIALLYCSGLRLAEALVLRADELDLAAPTLTIRGPRPRAVRLFPAARPYLETWLALRARKSLPGRQVFATLAGEPLEPAYVRAMLARLARRAGLGKRVHAHLLRHSHAARLAAEGVGPTALAEHLGHAAGRGARRALARFGVTLAPVARQGLSEVRWSLAPEPGGVRAVLRGPPAAPARRPGRPAGVTVRRWSPPEL